MENVPHRLRALPSWHLLSAASKASRLVGLRISELGLSKADYPALAVLDEFGPCSQAHLGRQLGMDRKDVSALLVSLESSGWVTRNPDPADVRRNLIEISPDGEVLIKKLDAVLADVQKELFSALTEGDLAAFVHMLDLVR